MAFGFPHFPYPPPRPDEGYWAPVTSTINWCEEDYYATIYSAEIVNTLTNLLFIALGIKGIRNCLKYEHDSVFLVAFIGYLLVGSGSFAFHSTLTYPMQLVDELNMIYTACLMCYATFSFSQSRLTRQLLATGLVSLAIFITLYYHYLQDPLFHQNAFALITAIVLFRSMYVMEFNIRPSFRPKSATASQKLSALELEQLANAHRDTAIIKEMWIMVVYGLAIFLGGFGIWALDNKYCSTIKRWRYNVGLPWGILLEGHGWCHQPQLGPIRRVEVRQLLIAPMAAPTKQSSRWGSFLQQAVAGVESRLDNILAEEGNTPPMKSPALTKPASATTKSESSASRSASANSRPNDRLQERLARAIAAKNSAQKADKAVEQGDDSAVSSATPSRTGSPITNADAPRASTDSEPPVDANDGGNISISQAQSDEVKTLQPPTIKSPSTAEPLKTTSLEQPNADDQDTNGLVPKAENEAHPRPSAESTRSAPRGSTDSARHNSGTASPLDLKVNDSVTATLDLKSNKEYDALLKQLQSNFEEAELQRQEEVHGYIERIDALQAKLQYLAKESTEAARKASGSAPAGSPEKKLADKEEQIALLMEEGQKLSKKELNHLTTIKKLRVKAQEDNKELAEATKKQEKAESDAALATDRWKRAQNKEKRLTDREKQVSQLQKDIDSLKFDRDAKDSVIADLKRQLDEAATQEKEAESKLVRESLETERQRVADLEEELSNLKIEKNLAVDRVQGQLKQLREKMDKDNERARMTELEMKTEQQMLESKLEVMRARAEEVSSGTAGDAQAKLLRQIETLQTQYAVASENWQGIEASLIARATNLEKERDEATRREADIRRKAREVTLKSKRNEDDLEATRSTLPGLQQELADQKSKLDSLQQRATEAELALIEARAAFEREKQSWQAEILQRVEEEKVKWQEEAGALGHNRAESPVTSTRRGLTTEFLGLQNLQLRRASARSVNSDVPAVEGVLGRRLPTPLTGRISGNETPIRQDSIQSSKGDREAPEAPDAPSIHTDHEDFFENSMSVTSPHQTINDMVSVSTAAAGPSVQLVERMSSAVRRLESEKVATKDDIARLSAQRDEARAEIVSLMREVQVKRDAEKKVAEAEAEVKEINARYETTLEMLGEKSELVDELKSDIDDIKAMYRELVERTVK